MAWNVSPANIPRNIILSVIAGLILYGCGALYASTRLSSLNARLADEGWQPMEIIAANNHLNYLALYRKPEGPNSAAILFVPDVKNPDSELTLAFDLTVNCDTMEVSATEMTGVVTASLPHAQWVFDQGSFMALAYILPSFQSKLLGSFCPRTS